ncbi:hypothetical protein U0C82_10755 [Fulvimarina sp. 2208YS6-2-32]|uniref:Uncharacterized protein n=1 Tax=Fulvimarina uroteuthidis TaxID=3098149 RepID=A0ABU5I303_9HYPH|nr:hypothetical protein [Fulvimarina sp. 2208YS6-2-32]MDY8109616.1 hypothetical protein [Fulvimarina sp. 2208YS6-2-32]
MGGSKFIPIVIAGLVGLFIGWLMGPDVGEVESRVADVQSSVQNQVASLSSEITAHREEVAAQQAAIAQQVGAIQTQVAGLGEQLAAQAEQSAQAANAATAAVGTRVQEAIGPIQQRMDALSAALGEQTTNVTNELTTQFDALKAEIATLGETQNSLAEQMTAAQQQADQRAADQQAALEEFRTAQAAQPAQPAQGAGDGDAGAGGGDGAMALLEQVGATGAVLFAEQAAIFGGTELTLASVDADTGSASFDVGGEEQSVSTGDQVAISDSCALTLVGVAGNAAFVSADGCATQQAKTQDTGESAGSTTGSGSGDAAALAEEIGATGAILLPGQAAIFGDAQLDLASVDGDNGAASVTVSGGEPQDVAAGDSIDLGGGCSVTLTGVAAGAAYFASAECGGGSPDAAGQPAATGADGATAQGGTDAAAAQEQTGEGEAQAASGQSETDAASSQASGSSDGLTIGEAQSFGDIRVFVSSIREDGATLSVIGVGRQTVAVGEAFDAGNGCAITVDSVEDRRVSLSAEGCEGGTQAEAAPSGSDANEQAPQDAAPAAGGASDEAGNAQAPSGDAAPAAAAPDAAPAEEAPAEAASDEQQASGDEASAAPPAEDQASSGEGGSEGTPVGRTARFGDTAIFVSSIGENEATLFDVATKTRDVVEVGSSYETESGCSVTVDAIEAGRVTLSSSGC